MDLTAQSVWLREILSLKSPPIALSFRTSPPPGVERVGGAAPAGCGYWKLAGEGKVFFTEASDHYNCPVGAHTHGVDLPAAQARELQGLVETMVGLQYIKMEEVAALPRRGAPFGVAVYAPLSQAPCEPDVVLVRGNARQLMLVSEAARSVGIDHDGAAMGRPACAVVPEAINSERGTMSLGCIGNRVYTGLGDEEFYYAIPGSKVPALLDALETVVRANRELEGFHRARSGG